MVHILGFRPIVKYKFRRILLWNHHLLAISYKHEFQTNRESQKKMHNNPQIYLKLLDLDIL